MRTDDAGRMAERVEALFDLDGDILELVEERDRLRDEVGRQRRRADTFQQDAAQRAETEDRMRIAMAQTWPGGFWLRIAGYGVNVHLRSHHHVFFSEREGHVRWWYVGPVCFRFLRRSDPSDVIDTWGRIRKGA